MTSLFFAMATPEASKKGSTAMRTLAIFTSALAAGVSLACLRSIGSHQPRIVRFVICQPLLLLKLLLCCSMQLVAAKKTSSSHVFVNELL